MNYVPRFALFLPLLVYKLPFKCAMYCILYNFIIYILQVVNKYIDQGVAELVPGVLFVDEVRNYINVHVSTESF